MSDQFDLPGALREGGYTDLADRLERKQLADQLREAGREDVAAALEQPKPEPRPQDPQRAMAESLLSALNSSVTKSYTIGGIRRG
jgi:hypothetical protein